MDNICSECNSLVCDCRPIAFSSMTSTDSFSENTVNSHRNSNDTTLMNHSIYTQLSSQNLSSVRYSQNEGQLLNDDSNNESQEESAVDLKLCKKGMNKGFLNVQGFSSKFSEIQILLTSEENKNLHIFSICESKLNSSTLSSAFKVQGFQLPFRKDNHTNGGGGIHVYVKDQIMAKRRKDLEYHDIACLWLEISSNKGKSFLLGSLYRNPTERVEWMDRFEQCIETILNEEKNHFTRRL